MEQSVNEYEKLSKFTLVHKWKKKEKDALLHLMITKWTLEETNGTSINGQSRDTTNIGQKKQKQYRKLI